jgi:hypothetical protein
MLPYQLIVIRFFVMTRKFNISYCTSKCILRVVQKKLRLCRMGVDIPMEYGSVVNS